MEDAAAPVGVAVQLDSVVEVVEKLYVEVSRSPLVAVAAAVVAFLAGHQRHQMGFAQLVVGNNLQLD